MTAPTSAAWRHGGTRDGCEAVFFQQDGSGRTAEGHTTAVEGGSAWTVHYVVQLDAAWRVRTVAIRSWSESRSCARRLELDGRGRWQVDGQDAPQFDGCVEVDLESSALTNTLPVNRLALEVGESADVPATYVRAPGLSVERLEQRYERLADDAADRRRYAYRAPAHDFESVITVDEHGLVLDYPGIARRVR